MAYGYYPGCSLHSTAKEYGISALAVCHKLNIELTEVDDWNCCGATPAHTTNEELGVALPYANLINAAHQGLKEIITPCAACYNRLKNATYSVANSEELKNRMLELLGDNKTDNIKIFNIIEYFRDEFGYGKLKGEVKNKLENINAACYYGCLLVRPAKILNFDDEEQPVSMDDLITVLGGKTVDWSCKTECCGGSHAIPETEIVLELGRRIFQSAENAGANCIAVACPLCHANLDMRQTQINKKYGTDFSIPVLYITELIGLAIGIPAAELGLNTHFVNTKGILV